MSEFASEVQTDAGPVLDGQAVIAAPAGDDGTGRPVLIEHDAPARYTPQAPVRTPQQAAPAKPASPAPAPRPPNGTATSATDGVTDVTRQAIAIGIDPEKFVEFANKRWGAGWSKNPNGLKRAGEELESYRGDPAALIERINAETHRSRRRS
ncbi:MAG: hypothetical protein IPI02_18595 [Sterolibacteriaceae bacterium]|nr:hypothetical protein [Sterolibacteriaceae bacterium]